MHIGKAKPEKPEDCGKPAPSCHEAATTCCYGISINLEKTDQKLLGHSHKQRINHPVHSHYYKCHLSCLAPQRPPTFLSLDRESIYLCQSLRVQNQYGPVEAENVSLRAVSLHVCVVATNSVARSTSSRRYEPRHFAWSPRSRVSSHRARLAL
ncbi:hypothetical protein BC834DRAFT_673134 [Gloeopeniophorella convolvens]|nr:hypothetical protein BC834DRAFT_673134 [Gloeopeniophorella convolvens]